MQIFIKTPSGNKISVDVDLLTDTYETLKKMVQEKMGISADQQKIFFAGTELRSDNPLHCQEIVEYSTLEIIPRVYELMQISVKKHIGKIIIVDVVKAEAIESVKTKIQNKTGISVKSRDSSSLIMNWKKSGG